MALYKLQFEDLIKRVLTDFDERMATQAGVNLVMGTAAVESKFGTYLVQLKSGIAKSIFQIEAPTFNWLKVVYMTKYPILQPTYFEQIEWDLRWAIIYCRLRYWINPLELPAEDDINGLAKYWKNIYNTYKGKGKISDFVKAYNKYVIND